MKALRGLLRRVQETAYLMVGLPAYEQYLDHQRQCHPEQPPLSREQYIREMQQRRYAGKNSSRCC